MTRVTSLAGMGLPLNRPVRRAPVVRFGDEDQRGLDTPLVVPPAAPPSPSEILARLAAQEALTQQLQVGMRQLKRQIRRMKAERVNTVHNLPKVAQKAEEGTVVVRVPRPDKAFAFGAGFLITDTDGKPYVMTNAHVVEHGQDLVPGKTGCEVQLNDGQTYQARLVGASPLAVFDTALLEIVEDDPERLGVLKKRALSLASFARNAERPQRGQFVLASGHPLQKGFTSTLGIVSKVYPNGAKDMDGGLIFPGPVIQTDAATNKGNSGGPLVNMRGQVVGMNFMRSSAEISWAIPVLVMKALVQGWGVPVLDADEQRALRLDAFNRMHGQLLAGYDRKRQLLETVMVDIFPDPNDRATLLETLGFSAGQLMSEMELPTRKLFRKTGVDPDEPVTTDTVATLKPEIKQILQNITQEHGFVLSFDDEADVQPPSPTAGAVPEK